MRLEHLILERRKTLNKNSTQVQSTYLKFFSFSFLFGCYIIKIHPLEISIRGRERQEDREKKKDKDDRVLVLGSFIFKSNEVS